MSPFLDLALVAALGIGSATFGLVLEVVATRHERRWARYAEAFWRVR